MTQDPKVHLPRLKAHRKKRRCPECDSDKWEWLGAVADTPENLDHYLLVHYQCRLCKTEFLSEEAKGSRWVDSCEKCIFCKSKRLQKTSREDADIEIWKCLQCHGYLAIRPRK